MLNLNFFYCRKGTSQEKEDSKGNQEIRVEGFVWYLLVQAKD